MFLVDTTLGRIITDDEIKKGLAARHPYRLWIGTTSNGATAPPIWLAMSVTPHIVALRAGGNHREITTDAIGKAPASPAPNRNLATSKG